MFPNETPSWTPVELFRGSGPGGNKHPRVLLEDLQGLYEPETSAGTGFMGAISTENSESPR